MSFPTDDFTFGGSTGRYRLIVPALNQRSPRPRPASSDAWVTIPYGGSVFVTTSGTMQTVWQPAGGIVIVDAFAYAVFEGLYHRFGQLKTPWHSAGIQARLDTLEVTPYDDGTWRGTVQFSWR